MNINLTTAPSVTASTVASEPTGGIAVTPYVSYGAHHSWIIAIVVACISIISIPLYLVLCMCWSNRQKKVFPEPYETLSQKTSGRVDPSPEDNIESVRKPGPEKSEYVMLLDKQADPDNPQPVLRKSKSRVVKFATNIAPQDSKSAPPPVKLDTRPSSKVSGRRVSSSPPVKRGSRAESRLTRSDPVLHNPPASPGSEQMIEGKISYEEIVKVKPIVYDVTSPSGSRRNSLDEDEDLFKTNDGNHPTHTLGKQMTASSETAPLVPQGQSGRVGQSGSRRMPHPPKAGSDPKRGPGPQNVSPSQKPTNLNKSFRSGPHSSTGSKPDSKNQHTK